MKRALGRDRKTKCCVAAKGEEKKSPFTYFSLGLGGESGFGCTITRHNEVKWWMTAGVRAPKRTIQNKTSNLNFESRSLSFRPRTQRNKLRARALTHTHTWTQTRTNTSTLWQDGDAGTATHTRNNWLMVSAARRNMCGGVGVSNRVYHTHSAAE